MLPGLNVIVYGLPETGGAGGRYVQVATMEPCAASVGPLGTLVHATFVKVAVLPTTCPETICWPELASATVTDCGCVEPLPGQFTVKDRVAAGLPAGTLLMVMVYGMSTENPRLTCRRSSSRHAACGALVLDYRLATRAMQHATSATPLQDVEHPYVQV